MARCLNQLAAIAVLILTTISASILLYLWLNTSVSIHGAEEQARVIGEGLKLEGGGVGPGFIYVYVRCVGGPCVIDHAYIYSGDYLIEALPITPPERLAPGQVALVPIPFLMLGNFSGNLRIVLSGQGVSSAPLRVNTAHGAVSLTVGFLAARTPSCDLGDLRANSSYIHWLYVNVLTGSYKLEYKESSYTRVASGAVRVLASTNTLDLSAMSWDQRYSLGPLVVFINPYRAAKPYTVKVIDIYGGVYSFTLQPLVDNPNKVGVDALLLWEDLWWPGTTAPLDNYVDHVVRFTAFTNGTVRIEVLHASGCYLHMFFYSPEGLPPFSQVPSIVD